MLLSALVLGLLLGSLWAVRRGWRRRDDRQADLPAPPTAFEVPGEPRSGAVAGQYVGTAIAGDWLDRVVVHDLGVPSRVVVRGFDAGLLLEREGALDLAIPRSALKAVRSASGPAGRVHEDEGLVLVTWSLGGTRLDTGVRADRTKDQVALVQAVRDLLDPAAEEDR